MNTQYMPAFSHGFAKWLFLIFSFFSVQVWAATPMVSAGSFHGCAVLSSGAVQCWGGNTYGQLGNGSTTSSTSPVSVAGISNAKSVSAGRGHSCAVLSSGAVQCWGYNLFGQLGNGSTTNSTSPVSVAGISNATSVSAGTSHSCAVLSSGAVQCWGSDEAGQRGTGRAFNYAPGAVVGTNGQSLLNLFTSATPRSLSISGPNLLQSAGRANLTATGQYADGTARTIAPQWASSNPAVATVSTAGVLSASSVSVDTLVTLTASFSDNGVTLQATLQVTITAAPAVLTSVKLTGASNVQSAGQILLTTTAQYADGSNRVVAANSYILSNPALGTVNSRGVLTVASVTADTALTVTTYYTEAGVTKTSNLALNISAAPAVLSRLTLIGAKGTLGSGKTLNLSAAGVYLDGSRKAVTANWQVSGTAASISNLGVLTAKSVTEDTPSLVTASYTEAGITVMAQYQIVVQAVEVATPVQVEVEATGTRQDFGLSLWTSLVPISGTLAAGNAARAKNGAVIQATGTASYKLFVVAVIPGGGILPVTTFFMLDRHSEWRFAGFPLADYLAGISENSFQLIQLFDHLDASLISGTKIYVGYGITDTEMLSSGRFKMVYQVQ